MIVAMQYLALYISVISVLLTKKFNCVEINIPNILFKMKLYNSMLCFLLSFPNAKNILTVRSLTVAFKANVHSLFFLVDIFVTLTNF